MKNKFVPLAVAVGFSISSAVSLFSFKPITAYADAGGYAGFTDYISSYAVSGAETGLTTDGWAVLAAYWMCKQCLDNPITSDGSYDITNFIGGAGRYYDAAGTVHTGSICLASSGQGNISDGALPCFESDEGTITIQNPNGGNFNNYVDGAFTVITCSQTYVLARSTMQGELASINAPIYIGNGASIPSFPWSTVYRDSFVQSMKRATYKISGALITGLPSWEISPSNLSVYINEILNPYLEIRYPNSDVPVYVYEPDYDPIYPTDLVTGIPKDWTITNPRLPDIPEIAIDKPIGDLPVISLSPYAHGVGFWWALVGEILDVTSLKALCLTFLGAGLLIYCLWRLGR